MKYFLDTNVIIDAIRNKHTAVIRHFEEIYASDIFVSSIVVAELEFGAVHSRNYFENKALYEQFIQDFNIVPFIRNYCADYGRIRHELSQKGQIIGLNDLLIAATTISNNGILVTHNTGEFERIPGIILEDWVA